MLLFYLFSMIYTTTETSVEDDVRSRRVTDDEEKEKEEKEWGEEDKDSMFPLQTLSNLNSM